MSQKSRLLELDHQIVETVIKGISFYESFFHFPFPFSKYEHIFCPEFNMGAMENPGLICMNEIYLFHKSS
jgi:aminopeptidase N